MRCELDFRILPQPTETTCGPTCLHAVYSYYGKKPSLPKVINEIPDLGDGGGTLAVMLGRHALEQGFRATIYTYNLNMFDPTWFSREDRDLSEFIEAQKKAKKSRKKIQFASDAYLDFLRLGGDILFEDLTLNLIRRFLEHDIPILTGLSATYLYRSAREVSETNEYDSICGDPSGHFVVLSGFDAEQMKIRVSDPYASNPLTMSSTYWIEAHRVVSSILLGILTYDANLLVIEPKVKQ